MKLTVTKARILKRQPDRGFRSFLELTINGKVVLLGEDSIRLEPLAAGYVWLGPEWDLPPVVLPPKPGAGQARARLDHYTDDPIIVAQARQFLVSLYGPDVLKVD